MKLLAFNLIVGAIPILCLGIVFYSRSTRIVQEKVAETYQELFNSSRIAAERNLRHIESVMLQFLNGSDLSAALTRSLPPEEFQYAMSINRTLYQMDPFSKGVDKVSIVNLANGWKLEDGGLSYSPEADAYGRFASRIPQAQTGAWFAADGILLVQRLPLYSPAPVGYSVARLPYETFVNQLSAGSKERRFIVLDADGIVLAHPDRRLVGNELPPNTAAAGLLKAKSENGFIFPGRGKDTAAVIYAKSEYNGWLYAMEIPRDDFFKDSRAIGFLIILACIVLLGAASTASLFGSKRFYDPIHALLEAANEVGGNVEDESSAERKDDLRTVADRITRLIANRSELERLIERQRAELRPFFMLQLFLGNLADEEITERTDYFAMKKERRYFAVLLLEFEVTDTPLSDRERHILLASARDLIGDQFPAIPIGRALGAILPGDSKEDFWTMASSILKSIKESFGIKATVGVSRCFEELSETPIAYSEAKEALSARRRLGSGGVLFLDDVRPADSVQPAVIPSSLSGKLRDAIREGGEESVNNLLNAAFENGRIGEVGDCAHRLPLLSLFTDLLRVAQELGLDLSFVVREKRSALDELLSEQIIDPPAWFRDRMIRPIIAQLEHHRVSQSSRIWREVTRYIEEGFGSDLSLEDCADRIGVHPSYIKRVLKRDHGTSFSEYLSEFRIDIAKRWLEGSDLKITEIAERLTYRSPQNFIRHFRNVIGTSPGRYRESITGKRS